MLGANPPPQQTTVVATPIQGVQQTVVQQTTVTTTQTVVQQQPPLVVVEARPIGNPEAGQATVEGTVVDVKGADVPTQQVYQASPVYPAQVAPAPETQRIRRENVMGFGFVPEQEWKHVAANLAGCYVSCTMMPWQYCGSPCPQIYLCCPSPFDIPCPCPLARCLMFKTVDEDTLKLSCGTCCCCPLAVCDAKASGALYTRDDGEAGRPYGPPNAFTRADGKETFEVGCNRLCAASSPATCYLRIC